MKRQTGGVGLALVQLGQYLQNYPHKQDVTYPSQTTVAGRLLWDDNTLSLVINEMTINNLTPNEALECLGLLDE